MKKIGIGLLTGLVMILIGFGLNILFTFIFPTFQTIYQNTAIFLSMTEPRAMLFWIYPFVLALGLVWLWGMLPKQAKRPTTFASIYFAIAAAPMFFINVGSFNLPVMMVVTWVIMSYVNGLVAGFMFSKLLK